MATHRSMMVERSHEMTQKPLRDTFFSLKNASQRPVSVTTEFMETDWEMDEELSEVHSEFEEDGEPSPRGSFHSANSSGQPSITTLSSYEEVQTPRSGEQRFVFPIEVDSAKPVEGPRGPHLFRSSIQSADSVEFQNALSLSPITPRVVGPRMEKEAGLAAQLRGHHQPRSQASLFQFTDEELDTEDLSDWTPEKVAQWMLNAGVELPAAERFVENDINGAILITLKFEDLRELGITSFGVRTKIWEQIHVMRNMRPVSPQPETPIEDEPSREVRREEQRLNGDSKAKRSRSKRAKPCTGDDVISPLESVSIVGIEQVMPKPHHCSKGENCSKWKKNKRLMDAFLKEHPHVQMGETNTNGVILVAGDPGNPATAEALNKPLVRPAPFGDDFFRPVSDALPSVVASSGVMTPGMPPLQYLQEESLRNIQARDPQDNVRQFLNFQQGGGNSSEVPPTPPFELYPGQTAPQPAQRHAHHGLRRLPRLAIPRSQVPRDEHRPVASAVPLETETEMEEDEEVIDSASDTTPTAGVYRFGTPFSEMDVPVTAIALGPVAREASQSVPPDMNYRHNPNPNPNPSPPARSASRSTRRPSLNVLPALDEDKVTSVQSARRGASAGRVNVAPPRVQYPWSQPNRPLERAIPPVPGAAAPSAVATPGSSEVTMAGPMRKRKTKLLRHEWNEHYFTLRGTRLNMHKDAASREKRTLEYIDIDDYAIACSSVATSSKLSAAFKAMNIRRGSNPEKGDVAAFSFQLIPQDQRGSSSSSSGGGGGGGAVPRLLKKRESGMSALSGLTGNSTGSSSSGGSTSISSSSTGTGNPASVSTPSLASPPPPPEGAANGTGKTHHFAVKGRDERIDWMRELMLAKALRQKGDGFEVSVNGNMI